MFADNNTKFLEIRPSVTQKSNYVNKIT